MSGKLWKDLPSICSSQRSHSGPSKMLGGGLWACWNAASRNGTNCSLPSNLSPLTFLTIHLPHRVKLYCMVCPLTSISNSLIGLYIWDFIYKSASKSIPQGLKDSPHFCSLLASGSEKKCVLSSRELGVTKNMHQLWVHKNQIGKH